MAEYDNLDWLPGTIKATERECLAFVDHDISTISKREIDNHFSAIAGIEGTLKSISNANEAEGVRLWKLYYANIERLQKIRQDAL